MWIATLQRTPDLDCPDKLKLRIAFSDGSGRSFQKTYDLPADGIVSIEDLKGLVTADLARLQKLDAIRNQLLTLNGKVLP